MIAAVSSTRGKTIEKQPHAMSLRCVSIFVGNVEILRRQKRNLKVRASEFRSRDKSSFHLVSFPIGVTASQVCARVIGIIAEKSNAKRKRRATAGFLLAVPLNGDFIKLSFSVSFSFSSSNLCPARLDA